MFRSNWMGPKKRWRDAKRRARLEFGAETDESVDTDASHEIDEHAPIHLEAGMTERFGKMGKEREIVDGVTDKDSSQILEPPPGSCAEILLGHGGIALDIRRFAGSSRTEEEGGMAI